MKSQDGDIIKRQKESAVILLQNYFVSFLSCLVTEKKTDGR